MAVNWSNLNEFASYKSGGCAGAARDGRDPAVEVVTLAHPVTRESDRCPQAQPCNSDDATRRREGVDLDARGVRVLHVVGAGILGNVQGVGDGKMELSGVPMPRASIYSLGGFPGRETDDAMRRQNGCAVSVPRAGAG